MNLFKFVAVLCLFATYILVQAKPADMGCNICGYEGAVKRFTGGRPSPTRTTSTLRDWSQFPIVPRTFGNKTRFSPEVVRRLKFFRDLDGSPFDKKWG